MRIVFCSNFLSAHQRPLCDELYALTEGDFYFVASQPLSIIRKSMGWTEEETPYVIAGYESEENHQLALELIRDADVVLYSGDTIGPSFDIAIKNPNTLVFRCNERAYKNGRWRVISPRGIKMRWDSYGKQPKKNLYMLCNSAYTAGDYALLGSYLGRCYKWGYFVQVPQQDMDAVMQQKEKNYLFWAGRLLDCKHPESVLSVAAHLKKKGIPFRLDIAGNGDMEVVLRQRIAEEGLADEVHLLGVLSQEETAQRMHKASVYLATSDYGEGWGAVIGEAMSHGCGVVACDAMGSVPFLIRDGHNGFSYPFGQEQLLCQKVERLLGDDVLRERMSRNAYETMHTLWNPQVAAQRLLALAAALKNGETQPFKQGPCSKARVFRKGE